MTLRVDKHLWIGEEDELPPPMIEFGYSGMDSCAKCGASGANAWIYAAWPRPGRRFLEVFLCRECLIELIKYTYYQGSSTPRPEPMPDWLRVASPPEKKKRSAPNRPSISVATRFDIFKRDGYRCQICGQPADENLTLHLDHKIAVAAGGSNDPENLWVLCSECNLGKGIQAL